MKFRGSMCLALCLVSVSACSSSDDPTPPVEDTSTGGDTAPDTMVPDTASAEDTLSVDSNAPDSTTLDSTTDATDSMVDSEADTAAVDSGADTTVSDSGSDTAADSADTSADTSVADTGTDLGVDPCALVPACPAAASGNVQFCGSVFDLADTTRVDGVTANVRVSVYDLLAYAVSPTSATPIATFPVDSCGRFSSAVTSSSVSRFLVAVDDASSTTDAYAMTGIPAVIKDTSGRYNGLRAFAMRKTTDAAWSTSAGLSPSLVTRGAYLGIFIDPYKLPVGPFSGAPVAGVQFTKNSMLIPAKDYYFSDTSALSRTTVGTATMTGANGAGVLLDQSVADGAVVSANGGLGEGCRWPTEAAASVPGLMLVQEFVMTSLPGWTCTGAP